MVTTGSLVTSKFPKPGDRIRFDVGALNNTFSRLLPAGFYYKTFMWPPTPRWWLRYEHVIRHAAGMGRSASAPDPVPRSSTI